MKKAASKKREPCKDDSILFIADKTGQHFRACDGEILHWEPNHNTQKFSIEFSNNPGMRCVYVRECVARFLPKDKFEGKGKVLLTDGRHPHFKYAQVLMSDIQIAPRLIRVYQEDGTHSDFFMIKPPLWTRHLLAVSSVISKR